MTTEETKNTKIDFAFTTSAGCSNFLMGLRSSVIVSTYQTGNVFLIGPSENDTLAISPIQLAKAMGLFYHSGSLWIGGHKSIYRFNNILPNGVVHEGHDRIFIPHVSWTTGDIDCHDIVRESSGRIIFVNTLYSSLCTTSEQSNFSLVWRPPSITEMAPEDRCHLNGVALRDGVARYASAFSQSNEKQGWKTGCRGDGVIWDIATNQPIARGLTMPHSPRWYSGKLWCLESGTGSFGYVDFVNERFIPIITLPGYLRGLGFIGEFAAIGSSLPRESSGIRLPELDESLAAKGTTQQCGIFFVHLPSGKLVHFVRISEGAQEIYDVALLPNSLKPWAYAPDAEEIGHLLNIS